MNHPVPGLARGIEILRLLETEHPLTLEVIAQRTGYPKASVFRLMETLMALDLVDRDAQSKGFSPLVRLTAAAADDKSFDAALADSLDTLASQTGQTAEWYLPMDEGLVMVRRAEPPRSELQVRARIGFTRAWEGELDAVACVGRAWSRNPSITFRSLWTYGPDGRHVAIGAAEARRRQARARERGFSTDFHYNTNGVKRMAAAVFDGPALRGVLALAQCFTPQAAGRERACLVSLLDSASRLHRDTAFTFDTGDLD